MKTDNDRTDHKPTNTADVARHAAAFVAEHPMHDLEAVEGSWARALRTLGA